jgi:hypothetical protein
MGPFALLQNVEEEGAAVRASRLRGAVALPCLAFALPPSLSRRGLLLLLPCLPIIVDFSRCLRIG